MTPIVLAVLVGLLAGVLLTRHLHHLLPCRDCYRCGRKMGCSRLGALMVAIRCEVDGRNV